MPRPIRHLRRFVLLATGLLGLSIGLVLVWMLVRPGVMQTVPTWQLAAVLALLICPPLVLLLMRLERHCALRAQHAQHADDRRLSTSG